VPCSLRHTRPNLPGRGTSPLAVPGRPQRAGRRLIACSPPGSTGGSEGVPPACVTASPLSTTLAGLPSLGPGGERREVRGGTGTHGGEAPHPPLRHEQPPVIARRTGWGMVRHHQACRHRTPTRVRAEALESTATNSVERGCCGPRGLRRLSRFSAWPQVPPRLASCANRPRDVDPSPNQSSAQRRAAVHEATVGAEPLKPVSRSHPVPLSSPLLGSMTVSPRRCRQGRCRHAGRGNALAASSRSWRATSDQSSACRLRAPWDR